MATSTTSLGDIEVLRNFVREFYVYSYKSRGEYLSGQTGNSFSGGKSTYHNNLNKIQYWLGRFLKTNKAKRKTVSFLAIDSTSITNNPLYGLFKRKAFDDTEIREDFLILDILSDGDKSLSQIMDALDNTYGFSPEKGTIINRLDYLMKQGCIISNTDNKEKNFSINKNPALDEWQDALQYASEALPLGVIGSFVLDRTMNEPAVCFNHHYLFDTLDTVPFYAVLEALRTKRIIEIEYYRKATNLISKVSAMPMALYISSQTGRQYVCVYNTKHLDYQFLRIDRIKEATVTDNTLDDYDEIRDKYNDISRHIWGISMPHQNPTCKHISIDLKILPEEPYLLRRLEREKRMGTIKRLDNNLYRFEVDLYDPYEIKPWIRSWFGHIVKINCDDETLNNDIKSEIKTMLKGYENNE